MKHPNNPISMSDNHSEAARDLKAALGGDTSLVFISGGTARARSHLATEAIESSRRWLRVSRPTREQAHLALDLLLDGTVLLDGIEGLDAMEVAARAIREAHAGSQRRVLLSGVLDDYGWDLPAKRVHLAHTPKRTPNHQTAPSEAPHALPPAH